MRKKSFLFLLLAFMALSGCAATGPGLRYTYAEIETYPLETREAIRKGEVAIGMSPIQVRYALGPPTAARTVAPEEGKLAEEWSYRSPMGLKKKFILFESHRVVRIETEETKMPTIRVERAGETDAK